MHRIQKYSRDTFSLRRCIQKSPPGVFLVMQRIALALLLLIAALVIALNRADDSHSHSKFTNPPSDHKRSNSPRPASLPSSSSTLTPDSLLAMNRKAWRHKLTALRAEGAIDFALEEELLTLRTEFQNAPAEQRPILFAAISSLLEPRPDSPSAAPLHFPPIPEFE